MSKFSDIKLNWNKVFWKSWLFLLQTLFKFMYQNKPNLIAFSGTF